MDAPAGLIRLSDCLHAHAGLGNCVPLLFRPAAGIKGLTGRAATTSDWTPVQAFALLPPKFSVCVGVPVGTRSPVLEGLSQALARFLPDCALPGDLLGKEGSRSGRSAAAPATDCVISSSTLSRGEVVESHDKGRGYEVADKRFLMVEDEELYAARAAQPIAPIGAAEPSEARASSAPPRKADARHPVEEDEGDEPEELAGPLPVGQRPENTRTIEIEHFVPRVQLAPAFSKSRTL